VISWETNDPAGAEMRVSTAPGDEKLVSLRQSGQTEIAWIVNSTIYDFRLYAVSQPDSPIDSVKVRRDLNSAFKVLRELADEALRETLTWQNYPGSSQRLFLNVYIAENFTRYFRSGNGTVSM
jgi:hypothetical protein